MKFKMDKAILKADCKPVSAVVTETKQNLVQGNAKETFALLLSDITKISQLIRSCTRITKEDGQFKSFS